MKVGILTHYAVQNQGAQLQMYALKSRLEELGCEVVILTYEKNFDFCREEAKKNVVSLKSLPYYFKEYLVKQGPGLTAFNARKHFAFDRHFNDTFVTKDYRTPGLDAVVIGSDEVFSIDVGVNRMMYGYGLSAPNTVAYAPSFGKATAEELEARGCRELIAEGLSNMKHLSARDTHTQAMIKLLTGRDAPLVCDPVLLWDTSKLEREVKPIRKPYLALYSYDRNMNSPAEIAAIRAYAKERGLMTISVGTYHKWCDRNIMCSPLDWFEYMKQASLIVTDTFHGTVVALKCARPVAVFIRESINAFKLRSLLCETGAEGRRLNAVTQAELVRVFASPQPDALIQGRIHAMVAASDEYLKGALYGTGE